MIISLTHDEELAKKNLPQVARRTSFVLINATRAEVADLDFCMKEYGEYNLSKLSKDRKKASKLFKDFSIGEKSRFNSLTNAKQDPAEIVIDFLACCWSNNVWVTF